MWISKTELANEINLMTVSGRASERLGRMLLLIADGAARRYATGLEHDEAVASAVCHLLGVIDRYDPHKSDAFSYVTTICINRFLHMRREVRFRNALLAHVRYEMGGEDFRPEIPKYKNCIGCGKEKPASAFGQDFIRGLANKCKNCNRR